VRLTTAGPGDTGATGTALDYASPRPRDDKAPGGAGAVPVGKPLSIPWLLFVALFCATMLLPTLGGRRVLTRHEVFAAEPAREMLHGGSAINWVIPHFAGIPRTVKPPTTGWLIAGSMALFHSEAEWVVRLPSGLSAILMTMLIADLAARWLGPRVGLIAGLMQATFVYVLMQGRLAEADMPMAAAVCLAMYAFARGVVLPLSNFVGSALRTDLLPPEGTVRSADPTGTRPRASRWLPILFYLGAGLSFLLKGVGIAFILASVAAFIIWSAIEGRDWRRCLRFLASPAGLLLLAVLLVAWPAAAWHADPNIFKTFRKELIGRASGEFGEKQPWYFYAGVVPIMLMPWLPFGIGAILLGVRRRVFRGPVTQLLLCWFVPGLLILSVSAWKHHHYVIPMMPPATLVTAAGLELWLRSLKPQKAWLGTFLWLAGCTIAIALVWRLARTGRNEIVLTVAVLTIGGAVASYFLARARRAASVTAIFATAWAVSFAVGFAVIPEFEDYRWSAELAKRANREVPAGKPIYLLGMGEHNTAFYLRLPIVRLDDVMKPLPADDIYAICPQSEVDDLNMNYIGSHVWSEASELDRDENLRKAETEGDRPVLAHIRIRRLAHRLSMPH
jgi:4-amino-4-deoxy-L-arabinose transferase-like glycosyltransferase